MRSGVTLPETAMSADQGQLLGALQSVSGKEFDKLYFTQQALVHRSALTVVRQYAEGGDDPNLQKFASNAIPMISSHAALANSH